MDNSDLMEMSRRLDETVTAMKRMVVAVATARQVKEFNSELRKNLLARHVAPLLVNGSATAAETTARASAEYQAELAKLAEQYQTAEKHMLNYDVMWAQMEAARSTLSLAKAQIQL